MERDEKQRRSVDSAAQEWRREVSTCNGVVTRSNDKQRLGEEESMKSIDKLREKLAMSMDTWFKRDLVCIADEIEAEISDRYIPLPLDADGVPIHIGDEVEDGTGGGSITVRSLTYFDDCCDVNACGLSSHLLRHVKPRTIEDVLRDCAWALGGKPEEAYLDDDWKNVGKYAAELRELMGGDA